MVGIIASVIVIGAGAWLYHHHQQWKEDQVMAQAQTGGLLYGSMCETCHGPAGNGSGGAPVLNNGTVLQEYPTTAALSQFIQTHMPASNPGILTHQQAIDLALWISEQNTY